MKSRAILLGPPGSGKGTLAGRLQKEFGWTHISSGQWLRREAELGTEIGQQVRVFLENGELVPDEMALEFMERRLISELSGPGFLLDGFPRTLSQAKALDEWLELRRLPIERVLFYDCSESVIVDRITGRRICANCGSVYHIRNNPPRLPDRCDSCGAELVRRDDDSEPVLRRRLQVYARQTEPLVTYYRDRGNLAVIDATQDAATSYRASIEALKE
jgi:adenylate kinase